LVVNLDVSQEILEDELVLGAWFLIFRGFDLLETNGELLSDLDQFFPDGLSLAAFG